MQPIVLWTMTVLFLLSGKIVTAGPRKIRTKNLSSYLVPRARVFLFFPQVYSPDQLKETIRLSSRSGCHPLHSRRGCTSQLSSRSGCSAVVSELVRLLAGRARSGRRGFVDRVQLQNYKTKHTLFHVFKSRNY